jgi:site-specific DNA-methyltransferase (cytosine-N4-specific)
MKKLLDDPDAFYKPKLRPSGHDIGKGFATDNGGAIPSNLLQIPNTESNGLYVEACKSVGVERHPARFPAKLPEFFIRLLTQRGDLVVDIFAGSNTTGQVAEAEERHWLSFELRADYVASSAFRFLDKRNTSDQLQAVHNLILAGKMVHLPDRIPQPDLLACGAPMFADNSPA